MKVVNKKFEEFLDENDLVKNAGFLFIFGNQYQINVSSSILPQKVKNPSALAMTE